MIAVRRIVAHYIIVERQLNIIECMSYTLWNRSSAFSLSHTILLPRTYEHYYPFLLKSTFSFISSIPLIVSRRRVVIWKALTKLCRFVVLPRPNIDLLSIVSTKATPLESEFEKKRVHSPRRHQNHCH